MQAQHLLIEFDTIVSAQNGLNQLKRLISCLAFSGKLISPNSSHPENMEELIRIAKGLYYSSHNSLAKRSTFLSPPIIEEYLIPSGWRWVRVGEICDLKTGSTPSTQYPENFNGDIRWLVSGDINKGEIWECEGRISEVGMRNSNCKILPENTVLIALNGQGKTRASVAILRVPAACNQSLVGIIPFDLQTVNLEYLYLYLNSRYLEIRDITGQNQRRGLNMGLVGELSVPLPPFDEQVKIVAKLNHLMGICDRLLIMHDELRKQRQRSINANISLLSNSKSLSDIKSDWKRFESHIGTLFNSPDEIKSLRKIVLHLATTGALTKQDSTDEPASQLIKRIEEEKISLIASGKVKPVAELPIIEEKEKQARLPKGWEWVRLGNITNIVRGGSPRPAGDKRFYDGTIPFLKVGDITATNDMYLSSHTHTIKEAGLNKTRKVPSGTLLLTNSGATLGVPKICTFNTTFNDGIAAFVHMNKDLSKEYFYYLLFSKTQWFLEEASRGQGQPNLNTTIIGKTIIMLPPVKEQYRIVAIIDRIFKICDKLEQLLNLVQISKNQLAEAYVDSLVGKKMEEQVTMKAPKTEVVSRVKLNHVPTKKDFAPLANLIAQYDGEMDPKSLWLQSGLDIEDFYQQLKTEMSEGWIIQPELATIREVSVS